MLGDQLLAAVRGRGSDGVVVTRRLDPWGPPVRDLAEGLARAPLLEPLVLLELGEADLQELIRVRDHHAALAGAVADPYVARRHAWHAFELLVDPHRGPPLRLFVPASWSGGYGGYDPFGRARILAEPGLHLVQLLSVA